ncbi:MAG TPA: HAD-IA family hydrolase [Nocardioides sp.]|jgi:sugar-phosphatase|nr:HAD-IA family hydrolase [Nocardioides sp.]
MPPLELTASAALFDMDGTLVDSTAVVEAVWRDFCREYGVDPEVLVPWSHGRRTSDTVRHFLPDVTEEDLVAIIGDFEGREQSTMAGVVEVPGARDILATIDLPWAVVTSAPRELAVRRMVAAGLPVPEVLVPADEIDRGKPDPEGYLRAADLLGVEPAECVVFEDAEPGVRAALRSGARVIVVGALESSYSDGLARVPDLRSVRLRRG